jgi:hypothetical protein
MYAPFQQRINACSLLDSVDTILANLLIPKMASAGM